jgi:acetylornithine deacetylase/succinyl-diaminopimelate desuccinylase-like protein
VVPAFIAGFTDSRWVRERGLAAYGVSPFALAGDVLSGIHGPDERIPTAELERGIERMTAIVYGYSAYVSNDERRRPLPYLYRG